MGEGCDDRRLRIYESENGSLLFGPFELHADCIRSVSWSPDGQRYVSVTHCVSHLTHPNV
jgi:WD40 repeat protein